MGVAKYLLQHAFKTFTSACPSRNLHASEMFIIARFLASIRDICGSMHAGNLQQPAFGTMLCFRFFWFCGKKQYTIKNEMWQMWSEIDLFASLMVKYFRFIFTTVISINMKKHAFKCLTFLFIKFIKFLFFSDSPVLLYNYIYIYFHTTIKQTELFVQSFYCSTVVQYYSIFMIRICTEIFYRQLLSSMLIRLGKKNK